MYGQRAQIYISSPVQQETMFRCFFLNKLYWGIIYMWSTSPILSVSFKTLTRVHSCNHGHHHEMGHVHCPQRLGGESILPAHSPPLPTCPTPQLLATAGLFWFGHCKFPFFRTSYEWKVFCIWLLSLSAMLLRAIHVAYMSRRFFLSLFIAEKSFICTSSSAPSVYSDLSCLLVELSSVIEL